MKTEFYCLYVGYAVFYFPTALSAGIAAAAMANAHSSDCAADPTQPNIKVTLAQVSPRIERVVLDVPRRTIRSQSQILLRAPSLPSR